MAQAKAGGRGNAELQNVQTQLSAVQVEKADSWGIEKDRHPGRQTSQRYTKGDVSRVGWWQNREEVPSLSEQRAAGGKGYSYLQAEDAVMETEMQVIQALSSQSQARSFYMGSAT